MPTIAELADDVLARIGQIEAASAELPSIRQQLSAVRTKLDSLANNIIALATEAELIKSELQSSFAPHLIVSSATSSETSFAPSSPGWSEYDAVFVIWCVARLSNGITLPNEQVSYELDAEPDRYLAEPFGDVMTRISVKRTTWHYDQKYIYLLTARHGALSSHSMIEVMPRKSGEEVSLS